MDKKEMNEELASFLRTRGISEEIILKMEENKIDKYVIQAMNNEQLGHYLPLEGDRIAVKTFCKHLSKDSKIEDRKTSLLNSLRRKLMMKEAGEEEIPLKKSHLSGNKNAKKFTRKIELGWINFDTISKTFKQVRTKNGGGTRKIDIDKNADVNTIKAIATDLFFRDGKSKLGTVENFHIDVRDYSEEIMINSETVGELYEKTGINLLRFFLATTVKEDKTPSQNDHSNYKNDKINNTMSSDQLLQVDTIVQKVPATSTPEKPQTSFVDISQSRMPLNDTEPFQAEFDFNSDDNTNIQLDVIQGVYPALDLSENEVFFNMESENTPSHIDDNETTLPFYGNEPPVELTIHRGATAFTEMIGYFKDPTITNKHIIINRIMPNGEREQGEDTGGILRDLISEFWTDFYIQCTVGRLSKVPSLRHDFAAVEWRSVANILCYGYRFTGYWPILLAKTFMMQCLYPNREVQTTELIQDFYNFLSIPDKDVLKTAENDFQSVDTDELMDTLDTHDCRTNPTAENIKSIILEIAHKELLQTPMYVCDCWREVFSTSIGMNETKFIKLYETLQPTNKKAVQILSFPEFMDSQSLEVSKYLKTYIRNLDQEKLKLFLRFCTGSDLLTTGKISVEFTIQNGLQRRPVAHTCGCMLQLSKTYESYIELRSEFDSVLTSGVWVMDII